MDTIYLKELFFIFLSLLPIAAIILGGGAAKFSKVVYFLIFGFGVSGFITSLFYGAIDGTNAQILFMAMCGLCAIVGYLKTKVSLK